METKYRLGPLEKSIVVVLSAVWFLAGLYYSGPWYVTTSPKTATGEPPALFLLPGVASVNVYGIILMLTTAMLFIATIKSDSIKLFSNLLMAAIVVRLYHFAGVVMSYENLLPPSYLSAAGLLLIASALWLWVKINARFS